MIRICPGYSEKIGVLIDDPGFFEGMNARENLEYFRRQYGIPGKECIEEVLKLVDLADTGNEKYLTCIFETLLGNRLK